ncbi:MAG TPA: class I SAM-dependent methyltransferase [Thermomicrobiaceae bacterium]|nr:class I SAM-dependent methyltransferase [Thermomicrobiaceae bacterium]
MAASTSSQVVAAFRAQLRRPHTLRGDPEAQARLSAGMLPVRSEGMRAALAARTHFIDTQVLDAIDLGIPQIVILGAGYDDRALRFPSPGVRFFELDHPNTQQDKLRRLRQMRVDISNLRLIPADFAREDASDRLAEHGHDAVQPTLFVCEGLLVYLERSSIERLLASICRRADVDSRLVASLAVHPEGLDSDSVIERVNARRPNAKAEPWKTILPVAEYHDLFAHSGWTLIETIDPSVTDDRIPEGRTLLISAVPE